MQMRRIRLQDPQLELFCRQAEVMDWHRLPYEARQQAIRLLAKLLGEHTGPQLTRNIVMEGSSE